MNWVEWISVADRLPEKSGDVLIFIPYTDELMEGRGYLARVHYSAKHKAFNAYDSSEAPSSAFTDVMFWADDVIPPQGWTI